MIGYSPFSAVTHQKRYFERFLFTGKPTTPEFAALGVTSLTILEVGDILEASGDDYRMAKASEVVSNLADYAASTDLICLDIEEPEWASTPDIATTAGGAIKVRTLTDRIRAAYPRLPIGYYNIQDTNYWSAVLFSGGEGHPTWAEKQAVYEPLKGAFSGVGAMMPSLYTFYDIPADWETYARRNIQECRRLAPDRPVYPFIWPQFHPGGELDYEYISGDFWRQQLEVCNDEADGFIMWGGYHYTDPGGVFVARAWDDQFPWWLETLDFLGS